MDLIVWDAKLGAFSFISFEFENLYAHMKSENNIYLFYLLAI
jgi:hypothetical protein